MQYQANFMVCKFQERNVPSSRVHFFYFSRDRQILLVYNDKVVKCFNISNACLICTLENIGGWRLICEAKSYSWCSHCIWQN